MNWVRIRNEYYLEKFSCKPNMDFALIKGAWINYDHHLKIRFWTPCFDMASASINRE